MTLEAPRTGEPEIIFDAGRGRAMARRLFTYPDGQEEEYKIWWYKKPDPVLIFPLTIDRQVVAIRQFRAGANEFILELPGGLPDREGEPVEETGERELLEEVGYQAEKVLRIGPGIWSESPSLNVQTIPLVGLGCRKVREPQLDSTENLETVLVPVERWFEMILAGEVRDAKFGNLSILALPHVGGRIRF